MTTQSELRAILNDTAWAVIAAPANHPLAVAKLLDCGEDLLFPRGFPAAVVDSSGDSRPAVFYRNPPMDRVSELAERVGSDVWLTPEGYFVQGKRYPLDLATLKVDSPFAFKKNFIVLNLNRFNTPKIDSDPSAVWGFSIKSKKTKKEGGPPPDVVPAS